MSDNKESTYTIVVETLKRLYLNKEIDIVKLKSMLNKKNITNDEYYYITNKN